MPNSIKKGQDKGLGVMPMHTEPKGIAKTPSTDNDYFSNKKKKKKNSVRVVSKGTTIGGLGKRAKMGRKFPDADVEAEIKRDPVKKTYQNF